MLGIGQSSNRRWQREQYKKDPAYRAKKIAAARDYFERECQADPEFHRLVIVRATISKSRAHIRNHEKGIERKQRRISELNAKLVELTAEAAAILRRRKARR